MNREDYIWAAIRIFGIYMVVLGIVALPGIFSSVFSLTQYQTSGGIETMAQLTQHARGLVLTNLANRILSALIYGFAGYYFLARGTLVFKLISKKNLLNDEEKA